MDTMTAIRPTVRRTRRISLPAAPAAAAKARRHVQATIYGWDVPVDPIVAVLLTSELVTNAIRYASRPISVRLMLTDSLLCEVHDDDHHLPVLGNPCPMDESGRGILLVCRLARRWGVSRIPTGKVVWFEL